MDSAARRAGAVKSPMARKLPQRIHSSGANGSLGGRSIRIRQPRSRSANRPASGVDDDPLDLVGRNAEPVQPAPSVVPVPRTPRLPRHAWIAPWPCGSGSGHRRTVQRCKTRRTDSLSSFARRQLVSAPEVPSAWPSGSLARVHRSPPRHRSTCCKEIACSVERSRTFDVEHRSRADALGPGIFVQAAGFEDLRCFA